MRTWLRPGYRIALGAALLGPCVGDAPPPRTTGLLRQRFRLCRVDSADAQLAPVWVFVDHTVVWLGELVGTQNDVPGRLT